MATSARSKVIRNRKRSASTVIYAAKNAAASRLRQRRRVLSRQLGMPETLLGGSLRQVARKCGKPTCHCAAGEGHAMWTLTYSIDGRRHAAAAWAKVRRGYRQTIRYLTACRYSPKQAQKCGWSRPKPARRGINAIGREIATGAREARDEAEKAAIATHGWVARTLRM